MSNFSSLKSITYSPAYTLVPTYECFNHCSYCNFRIEPGKESWMSLEKAREILAMLQAENVCEILILSGEVHPQSARRQAWLQHIYDLCELALNLGFLPHTNAGILSFEEMAKLKNVNVSMGLMLEQITPKLLETVHQKSPSKVPELRLQQLIWAGELNIPFTTGILLGIGETEGDRLESLTTIAEIHDRYHHIQEVILQPHRPGTVQNLDAPPFHPHRLPDLIAQARDILPPSITIQIPPNLVQDADWLRACLEAGATDLGGISPKDEVNPDYPHFTAAQLTEMLESHGWILTPRLPIYPQYLMDLSPQLQKQSQQWLQKFKMRSPLGLSA